MSHSMWMMVYAFRRMLIAVCVAAGVWWLVTRFGAASVVGVATMVTAIFVLVAAVLLRTSSVGQISWQNRLAGFLAPWGWALSGGTLFGGMIASWIGWMALVGAGVVFAWRYGSAWTALPLGLLLCWMIYLGFIGRMAGSSIRYSRLDLRVNGGQLKVLLALLLLVGLSVALFIAGHDWTALGVVAAPLVIVGSGYLCFLVLILSTGRKTNWH